jgi:hypothetical protein
MKVIKQTTVMNTKNYFLMCEADLRVAVFEEGVPPGGKSVEDDIVSRVTVYMDEEKTEMPFGVIENEPFLELFWRETGADCDGEEEEMEMPDGETYLIALRDTR